jgi:hypothetical protein
MEDGEDKPVAQVVPLHPAGSPRSDEARADTQWELLARREVRMGRNAEVAHSRIPVRVRWWIAAAFVVVAVVLLREKIAEWMPWLAF